MKIRDASRNNTAHVTEGRLMAVCTECLKEYVMTEEETERVLRGHVVLVHQVVETKEEE